MQPIIVTADDYGLHTNINAGIRYGIERGLIGAVSIGVCGDAGSPADLLSLRALADSKPGLSLGIHLMLTDGRARTGVSTITDSSGKFRSYITGFARMLLAGRIRNADIEKEWDSQIRYLKDSGVKISHLDSHQHAHLLPGIWPIVNRLAARHGIKRIRSGYQSVFDAVCSGSLQKIIFQCIAWARWAGQPARMRTIGVLCSGDFSVEHTQRALHRELQAGRAFEIMTHPGIRTDSLQKRFPDFHAHWEQELIELETVNLLIRGSQPSPSSTFSDITL